MRRREIEQKLHDTEEKINLLNQSNIKLKYEIETSNARMNVMGKADDIEKTLGTDEQDLIYNQIMANKMPKEFAFDFLKMSQQIDMFWLGRYMEFEHDHKRAILTGLLIAIRFGLGAYGLKTHKAYYVTESLEHPETHWHVYDADDLFHEESPIDPSTKELTDDFKNKHSGKEMEKGELALCTWRYGNIGNFVWYMKDLLMWLYVNKLVALNASSMINKLYIKVNNLVTFKKEYKRLLDPFKQVAYIISDNDITVTAKQNLTGDANKIMNGEIGKHGMDGNIAQLINTSKYLLETFCWTYGIPITSSKNQDLSSEASFSHSTSRNIAKDHDERVLEYYDKIGVTVTIEDPEMLVTDNQNADKQATATANTENDKNKKKAEGADNGNN